MMHEPIAASMPEVFTLYMQQVAGQRRISSALLHQSELHSWVDPVLGDLVLSLQAYVAADQVVDEEVSATETYEEWASWWQHTKAVHFPTLSRWLRREPRQVTRTVTATWQAQGFWAFPDASVYPVELGRPVRMMRMERLS